MDKLSLNNQIVLMRKPISDAVVHVIRQLIKKKKIFTTKTPKKAEGIQEQIIALKAISKDEVSKFALMNKKSLSEGMSNGLHLDARDKVLLRLATHKLVAKFVSEFRERYPNWEKEIPLLLKVLGIKSKKKKRAQKQTEAVSETDVSTAAVLESKNTLSQEDEEEEDKRSQSSLTESEDGGSEDGQERNEDEDTDDCEQLKGRGDGCILEDMKEESTDEDEDADDCEHVKEKGSGDILDDMKEESTDEDECILRIKKRPAKSKQRSQRTKEDRNVNSNQQNHEDRRTAPTSQEIENKVAKKHRTSIKKPCFVVSDKVCGTTEVRKLKLDLLDSEEIPVSRNSEGEKDDEDSLGEEPTKPQDSFFLRGDGSESGEGEENIGDEIKENYKDEKCSGGLNRRQRRNAMFGREDNARPKTFSGRSQFSFGSAKHRPPSWNSKGYHGPKNSTKMDVEHTRQERTRFSRSTTAEEESSNLHPSWAAKRKLNQHTVSTFQGKKIKFDE